MNIGSEVIDIGEREGGMEWHYSMRTVNGQHHATSHWFCILFELESTEPRNPMTRTSA